MAITTQISSADIPIAFDLSSLAASTTFTIGRNSTQVDNSATNYVDAIVTIKGIVGGVTSPTIGQYMALWAVGQNTSFVTNPIGGAGAIDGVDSAANLGQTSTLNSLRLVAAPAVSAATASLAYYMQPFSVAQLFGGILPKFWGLYFAHNLTGGLAAGNSGLFSFNGITYSTV